METIGSCAGESELGYARNAAKATDRLKRTRCIHDLPVEILANVFLATECYKSRGYRHNPIRRDYVYPTTLASICRSWRYVALDLPWLWSHIDLVTKWVYVSHVHSNYVELMSQRSLGATVDLSIWVHKDPGLVSDTRVYTRMSTLTERTLAQLVSVLAPLAPRTCRLEISSDIYSGSELQPILTCIIKLCTLGLLEALTVHAANNPFSSTRLFSWTDSHLINPPTDHQLNGFVQPVRVLDLREAWIPWDSGLYQGLTELSVRLTGVIRDIGCDRLTQILSACPALSLLSLRNVHTTCSHDAPTMHEPIYLKQLQRLELICARPVRLVHMLQVLRPISQHLAVRITLAHEPEFVDQLRTFFNEKSTITTLHVKPKVKTAWFAPLHKSLDRLSRLTLEDCDFADPDLATFLRTEHYNRGTVPWPWLYELRLLDCIVDLELLECLATSPFMGRLRLLDCRVRSSDSGKFIPAATSMFEPVFGSPHVAILVFNDT